MTYELTLADQNEAAEIARASFGSDGSHAYLRDIEKHPLAKDELWAGKKWKAHDHIHLTRYDGTDIVVWMGRAASGYHHPVSRYMQLVPLTVAPAQED